MNQQSHVIDHHSCISKKNRYCATGTGLGVFAPLLHLFAGLIGPKRKWRARQTAHTLDDRALKDIGLSRNELKLQNSGQPALDALIRLEIMARQSSKRR